MLIYPLSNVEQQALLGTFDLYARGRCVEWYMRMLKLYQLHEPSEDLLKELRTLTARPGATPTVRLM